MRKVKVSVLFVCLGNICRSPTAQGVFEKLLSECGLSEVIEVDSAGCAGYHTGEPPDLRATEAALRRGIDLSRQRGRQVSKRDFEKFDYILAMDEDNLDYLRSIEPLKGKAALKLFLEYAPKLGNREVPDPYYGGATGFERVLDMIEVASLGLLDEICKIHNLRR